MYIIVVQTPSLSASLLKAQCTLHKLNCTNANIMSNHMFLVWLFTVVNHGWSLLQTFSDTYILFYLQFPVLHKYSAHGQDFKKKQTKKPTPKPEKNKQMLKCNCSIKMYS